MAYTAKDPCPPWRFLYLRETQSLWCGEEGEEEEEGEKVSLKTHATARGVGKNKDNKLWFRVGDGGGGMGRLVKHQTLIPKFNPSLSLDLCSAYYLESPSKL